MFFKHEKEHNLDIIIMVVTSEATRIPEILMITIILQGKGSLEKWELFLYI
jgi:hypothetical protein